MGIFDELKQIANDVKKEIKDSGIKDDLSKFGKEVEKGFQDLADSAKETFGTSNNNSGSNSTNTPSENTSNGKTIPGEYSSFPAFSKAPDNLSTKDESKYKRCSMDFYNATEEDIKSYISLITSQGYAQATDVRFEKDNTYIIVDPDGNNGLNIVFHIKK